MNIIQRLLTDTGLLLLILGSKIIIFILGDVLYLSVFYITECTQNLYLATCLASRSNSRDEH